MVLSMVAYREDNRVAFQYDTRSTTFTELNMLLYKLWENVHISRVVVEIVRG